jgi:hypothetical protein
MLDGTVCRDTLFHCIQWETCVYVSLWGLWVLGRREGITGTLDPVRDLTRLTGLYLYLNNLDGTCVCKFVSTGCFNMRASFAV